MSADPGACGRVWAVTENKVWDVRPWLVGAELVAHVLGESQRYALEDLVTPRSLATWRDDQGVEQLRRLVGGAALSQLIRPHSATLVELRLVRAGPGPDGSAAADTPYVVARLFVEHDKEADEWRVHQADIPEGLEA